MPANAIKTKSRTAKSKGPKLKWWYVLPVIAIVVAAGYLVIRYSQASGSRKGSRDLSYMSGGASTTKIGGKSVRIVGGKPVRIKYGAFPSSTDSVWLGEYQTGTFKPISTTMPDLNKKYICVEFWAGTGTQEPAKVTVKMIQNTTGPLPGTYFTKNTSLKTYSVKNSWATRCIKFDSGLATGLQADITVFNGSISNRSPKPLVGVSKVWYQNGP